MRRSGQRKFCLLLLDIEKNNCNWYNKSSNSCYKITKNSEEDNDKK